MASNYHAFSANTPGIPRTIMLVEDNAEIAQQLVQTMKEKTRHYVFLINDARKAIDIARTLPPDLFLFDTQLPGPDSQEWPHRLHMTKGLEHIPALLINTRERRQNNGIHAPTAEKAYLIENVDTLVHTIQELMV